MQMIRRSICGMSRVPFEIMVLRRMSHFPVTL
jgi:hypothetical protein